MKPVSNYYFQKRDNSEAYDLSITLCGKYTKYMQSLLLYSYIRVLDSIAGGVKESYKEFTNKDIHRDFYKVNESTLKYFNSEGRLSLIDIYVNIFIYNLTDDLVLKLGTASPSYLKASSVVEDTTDSLLYRLMIREKNLFIINANCHTLNANVTNFFLNKLVIKDSHVDTTFLSAVNSVKQVCFINTNTTLVSDILFEADKEIYGKPAGFIGDPFIDSILSEQVYNNPNLWDDKIILSNLYKDKRVPAFKRVGIVRYKYKMDYNVHITLSADIDSTILLVQPAYNIARFLNDGTLESCKYDMIILKDNRIGEDDILLFTCNVPASYIDFSGNIKYLKQYDIYDRTLKDIVDMKKSCDSVKNFT